MSFLLPQSLPAEAARELERASVLGGPDNMPWPTEVQLEPGRLFVHRSVEDSGSLAAPWQLDGFGQLMVSSGTLMERSSPYHFQVELARGQVNHLRCQLAEWQAAGLQVPPDLKDAISEAVHAFGKAVSEPESATADQLAETALTAYARAADEMVRQYVEQMFQARHQRQPRLDTQLGCRLGTASELNQPQAQGAIQVGNSVCLPFVWSEIQPDEGEFRWEPIDATVSWALDQGLSLSAGPLIDFAPSQIPEWIKHYRRDLAGFADTLCTYVQAALRRYKGQIRTWQLTGGSNNAASPWSLSEDEVLWLTVRLGEAARQADPSAAVVVGIAQPWGEYLASEERTHSPFIFADTLVRSGMSIAALELEIVMGVWPRGSYCRDLLDASRLIDLYTLLGVPLRITLGYPSTSDHDPHADAELKVGAGRWREGFTPDVQGQWAAQFAALALCKPSVRAIHWAHLSDNTPHVFPNCGLFDAAGQAKPALAPLRALREEHLR